MEIRTVLFASASAYNDNDEATSTIISSSSAAAATALLIDDKNSDVNDDESQYDSAISGINNNSHDVVTELQSFSTHSTSTSTTQPQPSTNTNIHHLIAPSIPKILRYTIPAIGIWLCSPVLSMIDTASVGLLSGTAQQAALNPAASVTDCGALVVAFMYTATTNLISAAVRQDEDDDDISEKNEHSATSSALMNTDAQIIGKQTTMMSRRQPKTTSTLITALKLALLVGTTFAITLMSTGPHLLQLLMGNSASSLDPVVYSAALRYVRIRALGMPAMVVIGTAQSACWGCKMYDHHCTYFWPRPLLTLWAMWYWYR